MCKMLQLQHVSITFNEGTPDEKKALKNINLLLDRGEFVTDIGGNGAGNSTLMNIICGSLFSDIERVVINGQDVGNLTEYKRSRYIGRVFQDPMAVTPPDMNIEENLV